jgi:hypothetical protein
MNKPHLIIRQRQPWRTKVLISAIVISLLAAAWIIFDYGRYRAGFDRLTVQEETKKLQNTVDELNQEVIEQREKIARLESAKQVDSHANTEVRENLETLQQEILELREELQFYRSIVSPGKGRPGIHIHNFKISPGEEENSYYYNFTLIHIQGPKKHHRQASGVVNLYIEGLHNGLNRKLALDELTKPKKKNVKYLFKYFARFEGKLFLPKEFQPQNVVLETVNKSKKIEGDEKTIKWPESGE